MNKNAIKNYAIWARKELIEKVKTKAFTYGISENNITETDTVNGHLISETEKAQRKQLISHIRYNGYDQIIEEVAYIWFNRFIALRFMEVNGYLPTRYKVFSDTTPEIIKEAVHIDLRSVDKEKIYSYIENNNQEELYKYILISLCNELSTSLPKMFTEFEDYSILLFPDNLLRDGSVLNRMVLDIPEEDWKEQVQIIGWLYQYYNTEPKERVIDVFKGKPVEKKDIPAATQLFTTEWVVEYLVDNSLGKYWMERHPESRLKDHLKYYIDTDHIINENGSPEELKVLDPCVGSGHFLAYTFDVLMLIYQEQGYTGRDAVRSIVENNIYGLDIDERSAQLAYFSIMMKAKEYDSRFLTRGVQPHVYEIVESNDFDVECLNYFDEYGHMDIAYRLYDTYLNAKDYGSLLMPDFTFEELDLLERDLVELDSENTDDLGIQALLQDTVTMFTKLIAVTRTLITKYDAVVTNPPYLNKYNKELKAYLNDEFKDYSGDMFSVFIYRNFSFCKENGYSGMMTPYVWMFIKTYEKLRMYILENKHISTLVQMEYSAFEEATVPICCFVLQNCKSTTTGTYFRLTDFKGGMDVQRDKVLEGLHSDNCKYLYHAEQPNFSKVPGSPIAYWVSDNFIHAYDASKMSDLGVARSGLQTGNNDLYLKYWYEVSYRKIAFHMGSKQEYLSSGLKWTPQIKGGEYRKWYGNFDYIVNWENDGAEIRACKGCRLNAMGNDELFFKEGITWSHTTSSVYGARFLPSGHLFNVVAPTYFTHANLQYYILGLLNSCVIQHYLNAVNATMHYLVGNIMDLPVIYQDDFHTTVESMVKQNIGLSRYDWDSYETSWDFKGHPLIRWSKGLFDITATNATLDYYYGRVPEISSPIECTYLLWKGECNDQFKKLKSNEEELNRIFIDIYGLQDELTPEVEDKDVTVHCIYDIKEDIPESLKGSNYVLTKHDVSVSFISYAVGCMFGRYSLDKEGLAYAGGNWKDSFQEKTVYMWGEPTDKKEMMINTVNGWKEITFQPDTDNILPICDDEYFEDDIVGKFIEFVKSVYGEESLNANLAFIADALDNPGNTPKEVIRNYFLNDFFKDHCNTYSVTGSGKRPIYWLFDAGKKNSFKALIYMHRYDKDTIARIRTDYIHPTQRRISSMIEMKENGLDSLSRSEQIKANKEIKHLKEQEIELRQYEEKIHVLADERIDIDLDDGVKVNYAKFADVLAKIK